jgi:UDP-N-acetylmuramoyl-L-alanyl-D-glutamate--2,6-diaminopimelate ligase
MGQVVDSLADWAIVTSDNPRGENPAAIAGAVLTGFADRGKVEVVLDRAEAIRLALSEARPGDCVLIAGKGHETYQQIGSQKLPHDDRQVARSWLYNVELPTAGEGTTPMRLVNS